MLTIETLEQVVKHVLILTISTIISAWAPLIHKGRIFKNDWNWGIKCSACGVLLKPVYRPMTKVLKKVDGSSEYKINLSFQKFKKTIVKMLLQIDGSFLKMGGIHEMRGDV